MADEQGHEVGHAVNLQQLLMAASGERIGRQSGHETSFLALMDRKFLQVVTEVDPIQAAAVRQISHREAPIGP